jgi:CRISPR/Cas system-associated exonuclease Cas4 (RecB family)
MPSGDPSYVSASELADYAYCPRSHWYRSHPPPEGPTGEAVRSAVAGNRSHTRRLSAEARRARHGAAYWVLLGVGLLVFAAGVAWLI